MKKSIPVNTKRIKEAYGVDLHEFEQGKTYPLAQLSGALGFLQAGIPKTGPRAIQKGTRSK